MFRSIYVRDLNDRSDLLESRGGGVKMGRMIAIYENKPATKTEIRDRISTYQRDLISCKKDLDDIKARKHKNGNPPSMPNAVHVLRDECRRRIAHYIPALKELYWVIGEEIPEDVRELIEEAKRE